MELNEENKKLYEKMKESGYDMFNINDPFYQDICTPFDSSNGTDILLIDRINYIDVFFVNYIEKFIKNNI